jgi:hypothetical protein
MPGARRGDHPAGARCARRSRGGATGTGRAAVRLEVAGKRYLVRVFVDVDRSPAEVVTVYRTSKIEKYWRSEP